MQNIASDYAPTIDINTNVCTTRRLRSNHLQLPGSTDHRGQRHTCDASPPHRRGYLSESNRREHLDGRLHYDVTAIFGAAGSQRNALLLTLTLTIAKWYIVELCNADIIYEVAKERYDRAVALLNKIAKGDINLAGLPLITPSDDQPSGWRYGSRPKFTHE